MRLTPDPRYGKYFANDLTRRATCAKDRWLMALFDPALDLNAHQIDVRRCLANHTMTLAALYEIQAMSRKLRRQQRREIFRAKTKSWKSAVCSSTHLSVRWHSGIKTGKLVATRQADQ